jgi:hypothetical protein
VPATDSGVAAAAVVVVVIVGSDNLVVLDNLVR